MAAFCRREKAGVAHCVLGIIGIVVLVGLGGADAFGFTGSCSWVQLQGGRSHESSLHLSRSLSRLCTSPLKWEPSGFGTAQTSTSAARYGGVRALLAGKVAISAGRGGTRGLALGVKIDQVLRDSDKMESVCLEAQLRKASLAKLECRMDDIYHDEPLNYNDRETLALHAASGMRVTSGCPMHLLHGVKGGCEACKCRVPTSEDVKKYCAYSASGKSAIVPTRTAWAMRKERKEVLSQCSALVILSGNEDISGNPEYPAAKEIASYQKSLIDDAKEQGVGFVLLVGPSDDIEGGAKSRTAAIKQDAKMSDGLSRAVKQLGGLEVSEAERVQEAATKGKLLAERHLESVGMPYTVIRAPLKLFKTKQLAHVALKALESGATNKHIVVQGLPGFVDEEEQEFKAKVAAQRRAAAAAPLNGHQKPSEAMQQRRDFFVTDQSSGAGTDAEAGTPTTDVVHEGGSNRVEVDVSLNEPVGGGTWEEFD